MARHAGKASAAALAAASTSAASPAATSARCAPSTGALVAKTSLDREGRHRPLTRCPTIGAVGATVPRPSTPACFNSSSSASSAARRFCSAALTVSRVDPSLGSRLLRLRPARHRCRLAPHRPPSAAWAAAGACYLERLVPKIAAHLLLGNRSAAQFKGPDL